MLAEVVARRTTCSGPINADPTPGSSTSSAMRTPAAAETRSHGENGDSVLLTDPHAHFREQEEQRAQGVASPAAATLSDLGAPSGTTLSSAVADNSARPLLVPQDELRACGRRRIREVDAAGVREALKILDAQFGKQV